MVPDFLTVCVMGLRSSSLLLATHPVPTDNSLCRCLSVLRCVVSPALAASLPSDPTPTGLQELLDTPNPQSPAQSDAYVMFTQKLSEYRKMVRQQALKYPPPS